jgi:hypothetical protein
LFKILTLLACLFPCNATAATSWQTLQFPASQRLLKNPDSGFYFMPGLQEVSKIPDWLLDLSSMVYFRLNWSEVADSSGKPDFERLDRAYFDGYKKKGLRLAFRIMAANPHAEKQYVMPKVILDKGIPTVEHQGVDGRTQVDPVFWNSSYLAEHEKLVQALGLYLDGKPWAGPVDLGGMGDWGEMHLSRWTGQELEANGWSPEIYVRAVFTLMDQMERHLPRTTKAFCVAPILMPDPEPMFAQIVDRAVRKSWWLRSDGCSSEGGPPPYVWPYIERWGNFVGLICEPSGGINRSYTGEKVPVKNYIEAVLKSRPSVVNLMGLWDLKDLSQADIQALREAAPKIGYRFSVESAVLPSTLQAVPGHPAYLAGKISLANQGGAPYFGSALPVLEIRSKNQLLSRQTLMPQPPLSQIQPGSSRDIRFFAALTLSAEVKSLDLSLALMDLKNGPLQLANANQSPQGLLLLGRVSVNVNAKAALPENLKPAPSQGISLTQTSEGWMLEGKNEGSWGYAGLPSFKIKAKHAYVMRVRLRAWARVASPDPIHFKLGVNDAQGNWISNIGSGKYDFSKSGIWQDLSVSFQPQPPAATLQPAMEKGRTAASSLKAEIASWVLEEVPLP